MPICAHTPGSNSSAALILARKAPASASDLADQPWYRPSRESFRYAWKAGRSETARRRNTAPATMRGRGSASSRRARITHGEHRPRAGFRPAHTEELGEPPGRSALVARRYDGVVELYLHRRLMFPWRRETAHPDRRNKRPGSGLTPPRKPRPPPGAVLGCRARGPL